MAAQTGGDANYKVVKTEAEWKKEVSFDVEVTLCVCVCVSVWVCVWVCLLIMEKGRKKSSVCGCE